METIIEIEAVRACVAEARAGGRAVALVPTMGYFHEGHLDLMRAAREWADEHSKSGVGLVVVSNFVNPTQFGPQEDFATYPRDLDRDARMAGEVGADLMFAPTPDAMYPVQPPLLFDVGRLGAVLCGPHRPGHFEGVATVVLKLFNIVEPDAAFFGWKDAQQLVLIRHMAADFFKRCEVLGIETRREPDGLAMSSRNEYLTPEARAAAPTLHRELQRAKARIEARKATLNEAIVDAYAALEAEPNLEPQYIEAVRLSDLAPLEEWEPGNTILALAAFAGKGRLIDNLRF